MHALALLYILLLCPTHLDVLDRIVVKQIEEEAVSITIYF